MLLGESNGFPITLPTLADHVFVGGKTQHGKSYFLAMLMMQLPRVMLLDLHGVLADQMIRFWAANWNSLSPFKKQEIHYVNFAEMGVSICPEKTDLVGVDYELWRKALIDRISSAMIRSLGQDNFADTRRMKSWLENVLEFLFVRQEDGSTFGLQRWAEVTAINQRTWDDLFHRVAPRMRHDILLDWIELRQATRTTQERELGSTQHLLKALLPNLPIFSDNPPINWKDLHARHATIYFNLAVSDKLSDPQQRFLGGLLLSEWRHTCRTYFDGLIRYIVTDEIQRLIANRDFVDALNEDAKWRLFQIFAVRDIAELGEYGDQMVAQAGLTVTFNQTNPESVDAIAKHIGIGSLDLTPLERPMDRPDGYDWISVQDTTDSLTHGGSNSHSTQWRVTEGETENQTVQRSTDKNWSRGENTSRGKSHASSHGSSHQTSGSHTEHLLRDKKKTYDFTGGTSQGANTSRQYQDNESHGENSSVGGKEGLSESSSMGTTRSLSDGGSETDGHNWSQSQGVTTRWAHLQRYKEEWHKTGNLELSAENQFWILKRAIARLGVGEAFIRIRNLPCIPLKVPHLPEPTVDPIFLKAILYLRSPFFFKLDQCTGKNEINISELLSKRTRQRSHSRSKQESSPIRKLLGADSNGSKNANGGSPDTSERPS